MLITLHAFMTRQTLIIDIKKLPGTYSILHLYITNYHICTLARL